MASAIIAFAVASSTFSASRRRWGQLCSLPSSSRRLATFFPCATTSSKMPTFGPKVSAVGFFDPLSHGVFSSSGECRASESAAEEPKSSGTRRLLLGALIWKAAAFACCVGCGACLAADDSIRAFGLGLKVATALRRLGLADELVVFAIAALPVLELRGAIPVGYWMQLHPVTLTFLAVLGNMVPVPFIILYLKKLASFFLSQKSDAATTRFVNLLFERAKAKAAPVEEFKWLGLMLFVAVPFPGTGAWTGAVIASILDMPFSSALSANLVGVVVAGLLVNLLVNLGLKHAIFAGLFLFFVSTVMWSILRSLKKSSTHTN